MAGKKNKIEKCEHKNGAYMEFATIVHERDVVDGEVESSGINEVGGFTGFGFICHDCKGKFHFEGPIDSMPNWFKIYYETADKTR